MSQAPGNTSNSKDIEDIIRRVAALERNRSSPTNAERLEELVRSAESMTAALDSIRVVQGLSGNKTSLTLTGDGQSVINLTGDSDDVGITAGTAKLYKHVKAATTGVPAEPLQWHTNVHFVSEQTVSAGDNIYAKAGKPQQVVIGNTGPGAQPGIVFGPSLTVGLYGFAADQINTDGNFLAKKTVTANMNVYAQAGSSGQAIIGNTGPSGQPGIIFGPNLDAKIYRSAANWLETQNLNIIGNVQTSGNVIMTAQGNSFALSGVLLGAYNTPTTAVDSILVSVNGTLRRMLVY